MYFAKFPLGKLKEISLLIARLYWEKFQLWQEGEHLQLELDDFTQIQRKLIGLKY